MDSPVKILHLEDEAPVVEIVHRLLKQENIVHKLTNVQSEKEFSDSIQKNQYDLILADFSLPGFDGLAALKILREYDQDVPFILFSGDIEEGKAIESLKMGCTDYVLKQNIKALVPAINRALREADAYKQKLENQNALYEREKVLSSISSAALDAIIMMNPKGKISFWNNAAERMFGYSFDDVVGKNLHDLITPPEYNREFRSKFPHFKTTGQGPVVGKIVELEALKKNGIKFPVELSLSSVKMNDHWGAVGIIRDITDRRQTEEDLRLSEERYRSLSEVTFEAIFVSEKGICLEQNLAAEKMFGYTLDEAIGKPGTEWIAPEDREKVKNNMINGYEKSYHVTALRKDGTTFPAEIRGRTMNYMGRSARVSTLVDISEQKKAEDVLSRENRLLQKFMDQVPDYIFYKDRDGRFTQINKALAKRFGLDDPQQALGKSDFDFFEQKIAAKIFEEEQEIMYTRKTITQEKLKKSTNGKEIWLSTTKFPLTDEAENVIGIIGISRDITQVKQAEQNIVMNEVRYRTLYESTGDAIMMLDDKGFFNCNPMALSVFGVETVEEFCRMNPWDLSPAKQPGGEDSLTAANQKIQTAMIEGNNQFEWVHKRFNSGEQFPAEVLLSRMTLDGKQVLQASVRDITERKKLESQLANAQKLESIGQLAAGIAHEINTPAQYVGDNAHFLKDAFTDFNKLWEKFRQMKASRDKLPHLQTLLDDAIEIAEQIDFDFLVDEIPVAIDQTLDGIESISKIVKAMKEFSHPGGKEMMLVDLSRAIENTLIVSRNEWKYIAEIETKFDESLGTVPCYPDELNQVLLNMIINATHAISEKKFDGESKGIISIQTIPDNNEAQIRISDNGNGIPKDNMNKIFDLFFTTKEVGKGTGQGLAIAHDVIVNKHHGTIDVESEVGYGTTFIIRLPMDKS